MDEESGESTNGDGDDDDDADAAPTEPNPEATDGSELTDAGTGNPESGDAAEKEW